MKKKGLYIQVWLKINGAGQFQMENPNSRTRKWVKLNG